MNHVDDHSSPPTKKPRLDDPSSSGELTAVSLVDSFTDVASIKLTNTTNNSSIEIEEQEILTGKNENNKNKIDDTEDSEDDDDNVFIVDCVRGKRYISSIPSSKSSKSSISRHPSSILQYLIKWAKYKESDNTWENESNCDCTELITLFNDRLSDAENCLSQNQLIFSEVQSVMNSQIITLSDNLNNTSSNEKLLSIWQSDIQPLMTSIFSLQSTNSALLTAINSTIEDGECRLKLWQDTVLPKLKDVYMNVAKMDIEVKRLRRLIE